MIPDEEFHKQLLIHSVLASLGCFVFCLFQVITACAVMLHISYMYKKIMFMFNSDILIHIIYSKVFLNTIHLGTMLAEELHRQVLFHSVITSVDKHWEVNCLFKIRVITVYTHRQLTCIYIAYECKTNCIRSKQLAQLIFPIQKYSLILLVSYNFRGYF